MDAFDDRSPLARVSEFAWLLLAANPGPMTLDGTNSYVLRAPGAETAVVVDPGPALDEHLRLLADAGPVELILLTHHHLDHTAGAAELARMTGAPVRAIDPRLCHGGGSPLTDDELIRAAGLTLEILATPGHTADSMCVRLPDDGAHGAVLTGDSVLGRGSTIIVDPDGALGPYLDSLERLREVGSPGPVVVLPGHGPVLPDLAAICDDYLAHRADRLDQVRAALAELGADASAEAVASFVYHDVDPALRGAAEASVRAQLTYLRDRA
jgi:glyoxylase-like metal-dependent hydrolase (beta-lactamase superfamily II)